MRALQLPQFNVKLKESEGKVWIFDVIRKKFIVLTPEEWVRQHLINFFIDHLGYPKALIKVESGLKYNRMQKRSDIVVYDRAGNPWMIVECKSFDVELNQKSVEQATVYNSTVKASYVAISNGLKHVCFQVDTETKGITQLSDFPAYK